MNNVPPVKPLPCSICGDSSRPCRCKLEAGSPNHKGVLQMRIFKMKCFGSETVPHSNTLTQNLRMAQSDTKGLRGEATKLIGIGFPARRIL